MENIKKNEFDCEKNQTEGYKKHREIISGASISTIVKASDCIHHLSQFVPQDNEILDVLPGILEQLKELIQKFDTWESCPHCNGALYLSDLPQYESVCPVCDENFG